MVCSPVSFLILTNPETVSSLVLEPINSTIFNADNSLPCVEPATYFDQKCGVDTELFSKQQQSAVPDDWGITPDTGIGCASVASCDFGPGVTGKKCSCSSNVGSCTCFNTTHITVKPVLFQSVPDARVCFSAVARTGAPERRCVYFAMLLPTESLIVTVDPALAPPWPNVTAATAVVGTLLLLTVRTRSVHPFEQIAIDVKPAQTALPSAAWAPLRSELPSQRWAGPAQCTASG
eukprot:CAMPEP_0172185158 /NCGR_PEP_ID=MMETSP1050-20130122/20003_1 /TAXON_ID=233186 /ORGANISM="Cryptomonas curvata, Strain CCAP979/52" /LENGTH=233 /DNA_ID=CAMNT_0012859091 /DNA_START=249 /DNA_END=947 /DNA_ORIENTATION=+